MKKVRKQNYPNFDAFNMTGYEELTGDILYKINGGRRVEGNGTKESEYVQSSSKTTASENSNSSKQNSTQSNPPSQKSNTEQETQQSKPTCTAAEIAAAKGAAANAYFESQDKKRQENKKEQKNTGSGSITGSNSEKNNNNSYSSHSEEKISRIDERDSKVATSKDSDSYISSNTNYSAISSVPELNDKDSLYFIDDYYSYDWIENVPEQYKSAAKESVDRKNKQYKEDIFYMASTVYGEARGENITSKTAVAWSIRNRVDIKQLSVREIVTKPSQYSCWKKNDVNYEATTEPEEHANKNGNQSIWNDCIIISKNVIESDKDLDITSGATHYFDRSMDSTPPDWSSRKNEPNVLKVEIENVENIRFFKGVRF